MDPVGTRAGPFYILANGSESDSLANQVLTCVLLSLLHVMGGEGKKSGKKPGNRGGFDLQGKGLDGDFLDSLQRSAADKPGYILYFRIPYKRTEISLVDFWGLGCLPMSAESLRPYDGWWFISDKVLPVNHATGKPTSPAPSEGTSSGATVKENWIPLSTIDNDRLEAALADPSLCKVPNEVLIHDNTGQRLSKLSLKDMITTPVYWDGGARTVRRSIWIQMISSSEDIRGGLPVPADWDVILEKAYQEHKEWISSSKNGVVTAGNGQIVEKLIGLQDALAGYALVLRKGSLDTAKLTKKSKLDSKPSMFNSKDDSIRLIRGYTPYYIALTSAIKSAEANGKTIDNPIILSCPFEAPTLEAPKAPQNLVFAVHGIGQKLAGRFGNNFINDCDALRVQAKSAIIQRNGNIEDILILPVNWRSTLYMGIKAYFPESQKDEESFESLVSMITLPNIPIIRDVASDVGLDILLYMTPAYFHRIIKATLNEIHRIYKIFLQVGGEGAEKTKISLVGHSLGAAIVSDLISFIVKDDESAETIDKAAEAVVCNLGFVVDRFFAVGSPLAMFFLLKQLRPLGCIPHIQNINCGRASARGLYPSLPDPQDGSELHPRKMMFACRQMYNIFHPYDPIAYRMEPLIVSPEEMGNFHTPLRLPYYKKGALHLKRQVQEQVQSLQDRATKARDEFVNSLPDWVRNRINSPSKDLPLTLEDEGSISEGRASRTPSRSSSAKSHPSLTRFNHHGRIDFSVEESLLENSYLAAIRSHFSYWEDIDIASFIVVETTSLPSRPTSPSH